jgi:hypothetical protein
MHACVAPENKSASEHARHERHAVRLSARGYFYNSVAVDVSSHAYSRDFSVAFGEQHYCSLAQIKIPQCIGSIYDSSMCYTTAGIILYVAHERAREEQPNKRSSMICPSPCVAPPRQQQNDKKRRRDRKSIAACHGGLKLARDASPSSW